MSEQSDIPYYKAGVKAKDSDAWKKPPEGKFISSTALVIDSSSKLTEVLDRIIEVLSFKSLPQTLAVNLCQDQAETDGFYSNGGIVTPKLPETEKSGPATKVDEAEAEDDTSASVEDEVASAEVTTGAEDGITVAVDKKADGVQPADQQEVEGENGQMLIRNQSVGFSGPDFEKVQEDFSFEDENGLDSPPPKQAKAEFCNCRSKCLRKPYCKCKKRCTPCCSSCHPRNDLCMNK